MHPHTVDMHAHWRHRACMRARSHTRACFLHFIHSERPFPHPCCHLHSHTSLNYSFCSLVRFEYEVKMQLEQSQTKSVHYTSQDTSPLNERLEQQTGNEWETCTHTSIKHSHLHLTNLESVTCWILDLIMCFAWSAVLAGHCHPWIKLAELHALVAWSQRPCQSLSDEGLDKYVRRGLMKP